MSENELFPVSAEWAKRALVDEAGYQEMYRQSVDNPEEFWGEHGKRIDWITPYTEAGTCPTTTTMCISAGTTTVR